ncbi:hypothetical protein [Pseudoalteromonas luteoviolacea]|uniref:hypothetical protein n=1 Tax=Pseudoalteromonas luteoviolacea TaxID=43657 RepID=UPI001B360675|nr:hypothetical protein [Pseudoalteromonas luteoviolacea]MBQ4835486.1 hypothetical protein [Pseudoalteromonas luteoviolacea]
MNIKSLIFFSLGLFAGVLLSGLWFKSAPQTQSIAAAESVSKPVQDTLMPICAESKKLLPVQNKTKTVPDALSTASSFALKFASDEEIAQFALQQGILDQDSIERISDIKQAAERLSKIALGENHDDDVEMLNHGPSRVYFSNGAEGLAGYANQNEFEAEVKKVTATFETGADHGHKVLVKWFNKDTNQMLAFKNISIKSADRLHYIKMSRNQWQSGEYRVEIYAISDDFPMLSSGNYFVRAN